MLLPVQYVSGNGREMDTEIHATLTLYLRVSRQKQTKIKHIQDYFQKN